MPQLLRFHKDEAKWYIMKSPKKLGLNRSQVIGIPYMFTAKSDSSAGRADILFRIVVGTAAAFGALYIGLYFLREWEMTLAEIPMFVPMIHGFVVLESITIAFLALGSHRALRNPVTYWIGIAFASIAIFNVFYILSWPGLHADGRQVIGFIPGTAAWIILNRANCVQRTTYCGGYSSLARSTFVKGEKLDVVGRELARSDHIS